jgi:hypothetical protein
VKRRKSENVNMHIRLFTRFPVIFLDRREAEKHEEEANRDAGGVRKSDR